MSEQPEEIKQSATPEETSKRSTRLLNIGVLFSTFAVITFVLCFGYGYYELSKVNISLASTVTDLQTQAVMANDQISSLNETVGKLAHASEQTSEASQQQEKALQELYAVKQGDFSGWNVAEAQYLVRLADDQIRFSQNTALALTLLQHAESRLDKVTDPAVMAIRDAVIKDIEKLRTVPQVDVSKLFLVADTLDKQLDSLPLPATPLQETKTEVKPDPNLPWWDRGLQTVWQTLQKVIIVQYDGANELPLVLPKEKTYLYQNLHNQMQNVKWALLNRDDKVYQASLLNVVTWINRYFDVESQQAKQMLIRLQTLQTVRLQSPLGDLAPTVGLFDQYLQSNSRRKA